MDIAYETKIENSRPDLVLPIREGQPARWTFYEEDSPSTAEKAYWLIRERIITHAFPPGSAIKDTDLSKTTGFGRTPIREALKRLEVEQLVVSRHRKGTFVNEIRLADIKSQYEMRRQLLTLAVALASRYDNKLLHRLDKKINDLAARIDDLALEEIILQVSEFNLAFARAGSNPYLCRTLQQYCGYATRTRYLLRATLRSEDFQLGDYKEILGLAMDGNREESSRLMALHVDAVHLRTVDRFLEAFI